MDGWMDGKCASCYLDTWQGWMSRLMPGEFLQQFRTPQSDW